MFLNMDDHRWWIWLPIAIVTALAISVLSRGPCDLEYRTPAEALNNHRQAATAA